MAFNRIFGKNSFLEDPTIYQYLMMNVRDTEYPSTVPLVAGLLIVMSGIYCVEKASSAFSLFSPSNQDKTNDHKGHISYLDIDGP